MCTQSNLTEGRVLGLAEIVETTIATTATADGATDHVEGEEENGPGGTEPAAEERRGELVHIIVEM